MPWGRIPADMRRFRRLTDGKVCILGRRTLESIPGGLPGRQVIVLSRDEHYKPPKDVALCRSLGDAIEIARFFDAPPIVCGGVGPFEEALPLAATIHLTVVHGRFLADRFFPGGFVRVGPRYEWEQDPSGAWAFAPGEDSPYMIAFDTLRRRQP